MARVTITFEDTVTGPFDGSAQLNFEADPPFPPRGDLTLAQQQALVAWHAVDKCFEVIDSKVDLREDPADPR